MTKNEKQLLLKDLSARLFYGVKFQGEDSKVYTLDAANYFALQVENVVFKPYLRPLSSMTTEEWCEYCDSCVEDEKEVIFTHKGYRIVPTTHKEHFFNIHHFDYRIVPSTGKTLIESDLAIEAPEGMYKTE